MACIFCDIIAGKLPASIIRQDEKFLVFMDLFPMRPGHVLIIPKVHACHVSELDAETRAGLFEWGNRVMHAHRKTGIPSEGHNLVINDGPAANQHVPHVHLHVVPRAYGDGARALFSFASRYLNYFGQEARRRELDALAERLRDALEG